VLERLLCFFGFHDWVVTLKNAKGECCWLSWKDRYCYRCGKRERFYVEPDTTHGGWIEEWRPLAPEDTRCW
jgi:hypothetical protein